MIFSGAFRTGSLVDSHLLRQAFHIFPLDIVATFVALGPGPSPKTPPGHGETTFDLAGGRPTFAACGLSPVAQLHSGAGRIQVARREDSWWLVSRSPVWGPPKWLVY